MTQDAPIRNAATIILLRDLETTPRVLMGQRGAKAAFMPSKFVFPGGAVDAEDDFETGETELGEGCRARLQQAVVLPVGHRALANAAIRELWEESGLRLGIRGPWDNPSRGWDSFARGGYIPNRAALTFFFRAITPPGRPRRFDARFFLANANEICDDLDDFSAATDELSHLQWVSIAEARTFNLPFITEVVLAELSGHLPKADAPARVPFYDNETKAGRFRFL